MDRSRRLRALDSPFGEMVDALDAPHVPCGDWMQCCDVPGMAFRIETLAYRLQHRVRTSEGG